MELQFNNYLQLNKDGIPIHIFEWDNSKHFVSDAIFHMTLLRVVEKKPMWLQYRQVHHFIRRLSNGDIVVFGFTYDGNLNRSVKDDILKYLVEMDIEAILHKEFLDSEMFNEIIPQLAEQVIGSINSQHENNMHTESLQHNYIFQTE